MNESKRKFKEKLKKKSQQNSSRKIITSQIKLSKRKMALMNRNIGGKSSRRNVSHKQSDNSTNKFIINQNDLQNKNYKFFNHSNNNNNDIPVSKRKNDIFKISARNIADPNMDKDLENFKKENNLKTKKNGFLDVGNGTDDEESYSNFNNYINPSHISEASEEDETTVSYTHLTLPTTPYV